MSAICAIFENHSCLDSSLLQQMLLAGSQAGPDGNQTWHSGSVGLGHSLLASIQYDQKEIQPYQENSIVVSADVRLDNRDELFQLLLPNLPLSKQTSVTDAELIAKNYLRFGPEGFQNLIGDFAFLLWDGRKQSLFCCRDVFGIRPLYYTTRSNRFLAASVLSQLFSDSNLPDSLNKESLEDYLVYGSYSDPEATIYQAIRQVPPAHYLEVTSDLKIIKKCYFNWKPKNSLKFKNKNDYLFSFEEALNKTIQSHLRYQGPIGLMLSGGLDSGSIAALLCKSLGTQKTDKLKCFSFSYKKLKSVDEKEYIKSLCDYLYLKTEYIYPEETLPFSIEIKSDEPCSNDSHNPAWTFACQKLSKLGGKVMLTGNLGETLLLSQSKLHFLDWFFSGKWKTLFQEVRGYKNIYGEFPSIKLVQWLLYQLPHSLYALLPPVKKEKIFSETLFSRVKRRRRFRHPPIFHSAAKNLGLLTSLSMGTKSIWNHYSQQAQQYGLEYAHPFADRRLHERVGQMPLEVFFHHGSDRHLLRELLKDKMPETVRTRQFQSFANAWFEQSYSSENSLQLITAKTFAQWEKTRKKSLTTRQVSL